MTRGPYAPLFESADDDGYPSLAAAGDPSPLQSDDAGGACRSCVTLCAWCHDPIVTGRRDSIFCSKACRQTAWRFRRRQMVSVVAGPPRRFAYADPPYPGFAKRLYGKESSYAGEVDHAQLIASLVDRYDGWALSTGAYALRELLPLCPPDIRVCAWVKPIGVSSNTYGLHNAWEPLLVMPGRKLRPGKRDWFSAQPARRGGTLIGRKPIAFAAFLFDALGVGPGDEFTDLFPGTGIIGKAWSYFNRRPSSNATCDPAAPETVDASRVGGA